MKGRKEETGSKIREEGGRGNEGGRKGEGGKRERSEG